MIIEENTKEKKVEDLAEALADGVTEDATEEVNADVQNLEEQMKAELETAIAEGAEEEGTVQESTEEETQTEETSAEEAAEETTAEQIVEEETIVSEEPKKNRKFWKIFAIVAASLLVVLAGIYVGFALHYKNCFMYGTVVNGIDCSGKTVKEVEKILKDKVESYSLVITGANDYREEIKGSEIGIVYKGEGQLDKDFEKQNEFLWPMGLFKKNEIAAEAKFEYDSEKLNERLATLGCLVPENQVAPVAATVVYKEDKFEIQEETYGTQIDVAIFAEAVAKTISGVESTMDIDAKGCYVQPKFKKDSAEVIAACEEMNKYLTANITYNYDGIELTLDKSQFAAWITVDENMAPVILEDCVNEFVGTVAAKYNTPNRKGQLTTPRGKTVTMPLGGYGRSISKDSEKEQILACIKEGKSVTKEPTFSSKGTPEGQNIWGTTYIEVDIAEQHIWVIINGQVALETDVITGQIGSHDTPTGLFKILEKQKNRVLRGRPGPDGKPSYLQPVDYWMRVTWSGVGFHDAGYRSEFGGNLYCTSGSHGCINMPPEKAAQMYDMISLGTPIVIHK